MFYVDLNRENMEKNFFAETAIMQELITAQALDFDLAQLIGQKRFDC